MMGDEGIEDCAVEMGSLGEADEGFFHLTTALLFLIMVLCARNGSKDAVDIGMLWIA